ncbi:hypothetical protein AB0J43_02065 [Nonomuraea fuscirosea]
MIKRMPTLPTLRMATLRHLVTGREAQEMTPIQVAVGMGIDVSNVNRFEKALLAGRGGHAITVYHYTASIGYPLLPSPEDLVQHRRDHLPGDKVAAAMGMSGEELLAFESRMESGGCHIKTVIRYSEVTGQPLTPTSDPNFTPPPRQRALPGQAKQPRRTREQADAERQLLIAEARQRAGAGEHIDDIAKVLKRDPSTIREYVGRTRPTSEDRRKAIARVHALRAEKPPKTFKAISQELGLHLQTVWKYAQEPSPEADS